MFYTVAGIPAGYGYMSTPSEADINIVPAMVQYLKENDKNYTGAPISIGTMSLQVDAECKVSINGRAPILVTPESGIQFDIRGINSIVFDTAGINYNIVVSY